MSTLKKTTNRRSVFIKDKKPSFCQKLGFYVRFILYNILMSFTNAKKLIAQVNDIFIELSRLNECHGRVGTFFNLPD